MLIFQICSQFFTIAVIWFESFWMFSSNHFIFLYNPSFYPILLFLLKIIFSAFNYLFNYYKTNRRRSRNSNSSGWGQLMMCKGVSKSPFGYSSNWRFFPSKAGSSLLGIHRSILLTAVAAWVGFCRTLLPPAAMGWYVGFLTHLATRFGASCANRVPWGGWVGRQEITLEGDPSMDCLSPHDDQKPEGVAPL